MKTETKAQHTPGALRSAGLIASEFQTWYHYWSQSEPAKAWEEIRDRAAEIIERETAAPELLEACTDMLGILNTMLNGRFEHTVNAAQAAIAKAGGGQ